MNFSLNIWNILQWIKMVSSEDQKKYENIPTQLKHLVILFVIVHLSESHTQILYMVFVELYNPCRYQLLLNQPLTIQVEMGCRSKKKAKKVRVL